MATTKRQREAVLFCEALTEGEFHGDINDYDDVSDFLSIWLDHAKAVYEEIEGLDINDIS